MRTTAAEVKEIMETNLSDAIIDAYILSANALVTKLLDFESSGLTDTLMKEIERWLTAHLIASTRERQAKTEEAGGAKVVYAGNSNLGLDSTTYGQMVKILDTTGIMAKTNVVTNNARLRAL